MFLHCSKFVELAGKSAIIATDRREPFDQRLGRVDKTWSFGVNGWKETHCTVVNRSMCRRGQSV